MDRKLLLGALESVRPGLASKDIVEHSTSFIFRKGMVLTYNDEMSVRHPVEEFPDGAIPAAPLLALLKKASGKEVTVEEGEGEVILKCGRSRAGIPMEFEAIPDYLLELKIPKEGWKKVPKDFVQAIRFCLFSTCDDMTRPILTNIHIKGASVESTDSFRLTRYEMKSEMGKSLLLPAAAAAHLVNSELVKYARDKAWVHFKSKAGAIFSCRISAGTFVDVAKAIPGDKGKKITFPENLMDVLDRAGIFSVSEFQADQKVTLQFKGGKLKVKATGDTGWFEEVMKTDVKDDMEFIIHPDFIKEILEHSKSATNHDDKLLRFKGKDFVHVVALVVKHG